MTDERHTKERKFSGPPPRVPAAAAGLIKPPGAAAGLIKRPSDANVQAVTERPAVPPVDDFDEAFAELQQRQTAAAAAAAMAQAPPTSPSSSYAQVPKAPVFLPVEDELAKMTFRLPRELRDRFRAAFHYTAAIEGDQSLSDVFIHILESECVRRENQYNQGQPFLGGQVPLLRGRRPNPRP